jgi:predicted acyltransferase
MLVPPAHLYHHGVYDPEGLLSTLPALGTTLLGILAMSWIGSRYAATAKARALALAGLILGCAGLVWGQSFPLNKRLWTSSFVLFTGGVSMLLFALLFWLIDGPPNLRRGIRPYIALGMNALTAYVLSEVLAVGLQSVFLSSGVDLQRYLYQGLPRWLGPPPLLSLLYSACFVIVCTLPVLELYRRRIFLKI